MDVEVFIGDLNDPEFDYEHGDYNDNCPKKISDFFPDPNQFFLTITNKIDKGELEGKQTDWGTWTAPLYPEQIIQVMQDFYGEKCSSNSSIRMLISFLNKLNQDKIYGLVACEIA